MVSAVVRIPLPLRDCTDGETAIDVSGPTVRDALGELASRHPPVRRHVFGDDGALRSFVNVYVDQADVRDGAGLDTPVGEGSVITLVPSIAGGADADPDADGGAPSATPTAVRRPLGREELARYSRHLVMPEVGREGQERLKAAKVLVVGAGGLGSPLALYLAAAGVGTLGLVDHDEVDATNLQRQVLYGTRDVGRPKLEAAADRIADVNPHVDVVPHPVRLTSRNALEVLESYDVVVDGSDNFPTRYLVNDACVLLGKPNVYGAIFRFEGQVSVFDARRGPCYRCLFREPPPPGMVPSCAEAGVLGVLPGVIGSTQALEAIKLVIGRGDPLVGRLLLFDALAMRWRELSLRRNPDCPVCGESPTQTGLIDYDVFCGLRSEETDTMEGSTGVPEITPTELRARIDDGDVPKIIDVREPFEWEIMNLEAYGARMIPLRELMDRADELDADDEIVLYCQSGARSARALRRLRAAGFEKLFNLKGGILAWAEEVDPSPSAR